MDAMELRLLIVEDSESDARLIIRHLEQDGFSVIHRRVESKLAMQGALQSDQWDLILSDFNLPQFDALEAMSLCRLNKLDIPFIVTSGKIGEETAVNLLKSGVHDYVMKDQLARLPQAVRRELAEARNRAEKRRSNMREAARNHTMELVATAKPLAEILQSIIEYLKREITGAGFALMLRDESEQRLIASVSSGLSEEYLKASNGLIVAEGCAYAVAAQTAHRSIAENIATDASWKNLHSAAAAAALNYCWSEPIMSSLGKALGVLAIYRQSSAPVGEYELAAVRESVQLAAIAIEREIAREKIQYLGRHDALTGLPNKQVFADRVLRALAVAEDTRGIIAVLSLDLDHFKKINDFAGHQMGDLLLKKIAETLKTDIPHAEIVARQGGDEFLILLGAVPDIDTITSVSEHILRKISEPLSIGSDSFQVTTSIGISLFPNDSSDPDALLKHASIAMYQAKKNGRNRFHFSSQKLYELTSENIRIENALRMAVAKSELELFFQPQIDCRTGRIVSCEALVRWHHPEWGFVGPAKFIPIAEDTGLIGEIGDWVIDRACQAIGEINRLGDFDLRIAVNVSPVQLQHPDFARHFRETVLNHGISPDKLELEITESTLMNDPLHVTGVIRDLKEFGVSFSVDDFGTGYSSLSYLKRFKIDRLKIDQSFVREVMYNADDVVIVQAIIGLARNLKLSVVAEGVETAEQMEFLKNQGCDIAQGYYISKPANFEDFMTYLSAEDQAGSVQIA